MSMFLTPWFFWFGLAIPVVILLYILKLKRTEVIISSTLLWIRSLQDLTANAPFQRLRKNLLLFLQLLVLVLLVTALARPFVRAEGVSGQNLCLLLDRSGSMQTVEDGETRLAQGKQAALDMIEDMVRGDKMMIVTFGETADVMCELTDNRVKLRDTVAAVTPSATRTRIRDAVMVAHSLRASTVADLHLVIISDGNIDDLGALGAQIEQVSYLQVGKTRDNAGIVALSMREAPDDPALRQTFALVHNAGEEPLDSTLTLAMDGSVLAVEAVQVAPGEDGEVIFAHGDLGEGVLQASLDHEDDLGLDNTAWLALRPPAILKVLLVGEDDSAGSFVLQRALALDSRVALDKMPPESYRPSDDYDLVVFNGFAPEELPGGSILFFNALPPIPGLSSEGTVETPAVVAVDSEHPVMRFLHPETVGIRQAMKLVLPDGARSLVSTTGSSLVADVSRGGRQMLVVAFDLVESNWPTDLSFPLFIQNVLLWVPRNNLVAEEMVRAGRPLTVMPDPEAEQAHVLRPNGARESVALDPLRPVYYGATEQTGVYTVTRGEQRDRYAVNLLDRNETAIGPAESLEIGRGSFQAQRKQIKQNRELWRWLLLGGILVLAIEWWVYSRRAWM